MDEADGLTASPKYKQDQLKSNGCQHKASGRFCKMSFLELIKLLDNKSNRDRRHVIVDQLERLGIQFYLHEYSTGTNIIVDLGLPVDGKRIAIGSHFDRVPNSGGANDNGSAIAVCFDIIKRFEKSDNKNLGLRIFFFDEEETGLKGSSAYVKEYGVFDLVGLINMELVGSGDRFALWPVRDEAKGLILESFESVASQKQILSKRFDQIVTNTADHVPFQKAGLHDTFTITCISAKDTDVAQNYYKALRRGATKELLSEILFGAPIFTHYHQSTDTFDKLSEYSISMTSSAIWDTVKNVQKLME